MIFYGKSTTGGAVNFISRAPELDGANGYINLGIGLINRLAGIDPPRDRDD